MTELNGQPAELRMTLEITRAATGEKETVDVVGHVIGIEENNNNGEQQCQ